jgi:hypothetical protein
MNCPACQNKLSLADLLRAYDREEAATRLEELLERYSEEERKVIERVRLIYEKTSLSYPGGRGKTQIPTYHLYRLWDWIGFLDWCSQYQTEKVIRGMRWYLRGGWSEERGFDRLLFSKLRNHIERVTLCT